MDCCAAVLETSTRDGQVSGFGAAAELGFYRGRAEARAKQEGRKGRVAMELLELLEAYDSDNFEEEKLTEIRSKAKMLGARSTRRGSMEGSAPRRSANSSGAALDVVKDRAVIEDW